MKKRVISFIMTVAIFATVCIVPVFAADSISVSVGEYLQMGTYYGEPVIWRCVDVDDNGPLMLSDKIITIKPFDACGTVATGSHSRGSETNLRSTHGSNYWGDSNIRSWLNSDAKAGNVVWDCGNPPDEEHVYNGYNEYDKEAGFLTNFSSLEKQIVKTVTQKSLLDGYEYSKTNRASNYHTYEKTIDSILQNYNNAYSETTTDSMFLLDVKQIYNVYKNRAVLGDDYYIGYPTAQAVAKSEYKWPAQL